MEKMEKLVKKEGGGEREGERKGEGLWLKGGHKISALNFRKRQGKKRCSKL